MNMQIYYINIKQDVAEKRVPIMLCGNKVDLRQEAVSRNQRVISAEKGERLARNHQAIFLETSSKDGSNVIEALVQLSRYVLKCLFSPIVHYKFQNIKELEFKEFYNNSAYIEQRSFNVKLGEIFLLNLSFIL